MVGLSPSRAAPEVGSGCGCGCGCDCKFLRRRLKGVHSGVHATRNGGELRWCSSGRRSGLNNLSLECEYSYPSSKRTGTHLLELKHEKDHYHEVNWRHPHKTAGHLETVEVSCSSAHVACTPTIRSSNPYRETRYSWAILSLSLP